MSYEYGEFYVYVDGNPAYGTQDEMDAHRFAGLLRLQATKEDSLALIPRDK